MAKKPDVWERLRQQHIKEVTKQYNKLSEEGLLKYSSLANLKSTQQLEKMSLQEINSLMNKANYKRKNAIAAQKIDVAKTISEQYKYDATRGARTGSAAHDNFTMIMDALPKAQRDRIRNSVEGGEYYSSGDVLEAAEYISEMSDKGKYFTEKEIKNYIDTVVKQRKIDPTLFDALELPEL